MGRKAKQEAEQPLDFIRGKVHVLVIDSNPEEMDCLLQRLKQKQMYSIHICRSVADALHLLSICNFFHVCISDLFEGDGRSESYTYLQRYGATLPTIYVSGIGKLEQGFRLKELGARAVVTKPLTPDKCRIVIEKINAFFLDFILLPPDGILNDDILKSCCSTLKKNKPPSVASWATDSGIDESYLRRKWRLWFKVHPKVVLDMYCFFSYVFETYVQQRECNSVSRAVKESRIERFRRYYDRNRDICEWYLLGRQR